MDKKTEKILFTLAEEAEKTLRANGNFLAKMAGLREDEIVGAALKVAAIRMEKAFERITDQIKNGTMKIEGKPLVYEDIGKAVIWIPDHAKGDRNHKDADVGVISSFDSERIWVRFRGPNGELCDSEKLVWK
jgi:hypothetical protein